MNAEDSIGTPNNPTAKYMPVGWDPSGRVLFYTDGLPFQDPATRPARQDPVPTGVYRVELDTKRASMVGAGEFADISPDGQYILVTSISDSSQGGPGLGTRQIFLSSGREVWLPRTVKYPKISPSGRLAAAVAGSHGAIVCLETKNWQPIGRPVSRKGPFEAAKWARDFRWITPGPEGWKLK